ncbi:diguanylate cyclase [Sphingomonas endolithica]|uniref:GGDEF domain-containing protein n=1 Tax=Sphingomonas endolithica TaxID=2972485 RepID=UPI0028993EE9|nr:diguanylate cyclase [Sphingomonas sp. ZFBP2030]
MAETDDDATLFARIGAFLYEQHLSPDPQHYAFAYLVITEANGPVGQAVAKWTENGVRLSRRDIEALGGSVAEISGASDDVDAAEGLVARTQMQVEGFADMMEQMRAETQGFGRDLAASADTLRDTPALGADQVARLTAAMLARVRSAESRLQAATAEVNDLRVKLDEARDNARRDALTGLPNRRMFEEAYAERMSRPGGTCIAVCDVDHFKAVNDRFGHAVGDRVLKAIAETLSLCCDGHLVTRYGGEEFAVLFSGVDSAKALKTLEAARKALAAKRYRVRGSDVPLGELTFSAGMTTAAANESLTTAFGRADRLLYGAKQAGRNQLKYG